MMLFWNNSGLFVFDQITRYGASNGGAPTPTVTVTGVGVDQSPAVFWVRTS